MYRLFALANAQLIVGWRIRMYHVQAAILLGRRSKTPTLYALFVTWLALRGDTH